MLWESKENKLPVKSWCGELESSARAQIANLANHERTYGHVAVMPDCHTGYGMPIGCVVACEGSVIPNAVGVDIGCGMNAVKTSISADSSVDRARIREILKRTKQLIPVGEGRARREKLAWEGFERYRDKEKTDPGWMSKRVWTLAQKNLGTLGGGNHFLELQKDEKGVLWLMLHSGSRNLGYKIAEHYNRLAENEGETPRDDDLAYLSWESETGRAYVRDMEFALSYATENRRIMLALFKEAFSETFPAAQFEEDINIHHNYAARERHFGKELWIHRKGATSARKGELGIIPGSMGTFSYIVEGLGNPDSFLSCSHGAGRVMSRMKACRDLTVEQSDRAMGDVVFDRWRKLATRNAKNKGLYDQGESPLAYKEIDTVIRSERDLVKPLVKLKPLGVVKG